MSKFAVINRNFTYLLFGRGVSNLGDYFGQLALSYYVYIDTNSPLLLALTYLAFSAPRSIARLLGGVLIDRTNKKNLMIFTEIIRGTIFAVLSVINLIRGLPISSVYLSLLAVGGLGALFETTSDAFLPFIVERKDIFKANSYLTAVLNFDSIFGPALAGLSIYTIGITNSLAIDSISFFFLVFAIYKVSYREENLLKAKRSWLKEFKEGFEIFARRSELVWFAIAYSMINFGLAAFWNVYLTVFALSDIKVSSIGWGLLNTFSSSGIVFISYLIGRREEIKRKRLTIGVSILFISLFIFLLSLTHDLVSASVVMFLLGCSVPYSAIIMSSYYQRTFPKEQLGRVTGIRNFINYAAFPFGVTVGGLILSSSFNVRDAFILTSLIALFSASLIFLSKSTKKIDYN